MVRRPPEIFITTPESLNIILSTKKSRTMLSGIRTVILDEIHALGGTKRGTYLMSAVERLTLMCGEFQRVALSATVRPPKIVAEFVAGYREEGDTFAGGRTNGGADYGTGHIYKKRRVKIIRAPSTKRYQLSVRFPQQQGASGHDTSYWDALVPQLKEIITKNRSTLIFTNTRRHAEKLTLMINEGEDEELAYSHHGSPFKRDPLHSWKTV